MRYILVASTMVLLGTAGCATLGKHEHKAGDTMSVDIGGGVKMDFVWCPPGEFMMGSEKGEASEKPVHRVRIAQGFWLGKYEVTKTQWKVAMATEPWKEQWCVLDDPDSSAVYVTWRDAQAFCRKLWNDFRLPSEAEWECACRAGSTTNYCFGDNIADLADYAWYGKNPYKDVDAYAHPVGQKKPNNWGLFDMHGNVWELCQDYYHDDYQAAPNDARAWESPSRTYLLVTADSGPNGDSVDKRIAESRIVRGGSYPDCPAYCRSAYRGEWDADSPSAFVGFRLVWTP